MKNLVYSMSLLFCLGFSAIAQNVENEFNPAYANKRGVYLLPQAGNMALGFDATPFLDIFSSSSNPFDGFNGVDNSIYWKYFVQDNRALRARLTLNMLNETWSGEIEDDATNTADDATKIDTERLSQTAVTLGLGYEFRRGNGRVQGYYGAELSFGFQAGKTLYEYGNKMTEDNTFPTTYNFGDNIIMENPGIDLLVRATEMKQGNKLSVGLGGFIGVEYFFAPQISIGGEFWLGVQFATMAQGEGSAEWYDQWEDDKLIVETEKIDTFWNSRQFDIFSRTSGRVFLMFHF